MSLTVARRNSNDVAIVDLSGELTVGKDTASLGNEVSDLVANGNKKILINMAGTTTIDSTGVGELMRTYTAVSNAGGVVKIVNPTPAVQDVLQITKVSQKFDLKDDEKTAVASFA